MLSSWALFAISLGYVVLLFAIAYLGDRKARLEGAPPRKPWVYSLALGVYCTSWTFYGAVGRAANSGWDFFPIYLGPMLVFVFGAPLLTRIVRISKRHNITSIADFVGARYGRHQPVAMLITVIAVIGVLPYVALQLKAVAFGFEVVSGAPTSQASFFLDNTIFIAALLAAFSILFGTREVVSSENHHGMVLAIAFESVVKLIAFLGVGLYVVYGLSNGFADSYEHAVELAQLREPMSDATWRFGFIAQTILAGVAIFCLPRQFHVAVVESTALADVRTARWLFPLYLALISVFVVPIAAAGLQQFASMPVARDTFVLELPLSKGHGWLALAAYLGGFSAATSMVIVETIALSTMLCNEVVMPVLLRSGELSHRRGQDVQRLIKGIRRTAIVLIVALAYVYYRLFTGPGTLAQIGLLSFTAVAQFAPSIVGGVFWKSGRYQGAIAGLAIGWTVWAYTLLLPELISAFGPSELVQNGIFGLTWLRPHELFGVSGMDPVTHGAFWSLLLNVLAYVGVSLLAAPSLRERLQAVRFLDQAAEAPARQDLPRTSATVGDLQELLDRFVGQNKAQSVFTEFATRNDRSPLLAHERADTQLLRFTEHLLAGTLGAASARLVMASMLRGRNMQLEEVVRILDETSQVIQFNRELLRAALEHLSQGVSVVDGEQRLVAWNQRYLELFRYPPGLVVIGRPIQDLMHYNASRGLLGNGNLEEAVQRRLDHMRAGHAYSHMRELAGGTVLEISGNPMPGGGFVTSYSDVTAHKRTERALLESNETLEFRVADRTRELTLLNEALARAKADADRANYSKTRFLAAASHDLAQPITAARLFTSSIDRANVAAPAQALLTQAGRALTTAEGLLAGLLDISRLDAGAEEPHLEHFELATLLDQLAAEFTVLARDRGLTLRVALCRQVVCSDERLLRRVLQNFISNSVRYTRKGRVLIGCRRLGKAVRIEVWDSGPGIPQDKQQEIFEEFRRLDVSTVNGERGLGLGLAIAERIARVLNCPLSLHSWPGRGSVFAITVPLGDRGAISAPPALSATQGPDRIAGSVVMCLENEPAVLSGIHALLSEWGCKVLAVRDHDSAVACLHDGREVPHLLLVDYHLDGGLSGISVAAELQSLWGRAVPSIIITADHTQDAKRAAGTRGYQVLPKPIKPAALRALMNRMMV